MAANILEFSDFVLSSRGLMARPMMPNNIAAVRDDIDLLTYFIYDLTNPGPPQTDVIPVANVMFTVLQPWGKDGKGFTFLWPMDGAFFANPNRYRIIVVFKIKNPHSTYPTIQGKSFRLVWQNNVTDPSV